ncbi:PREDICTED: MATH domain and coiled-coil domain-containing protein At3g58210-like [Camelina sativa]|uniref:MATH domain and coiled-coil domain-containing protein At3g58210-like n=1 Tax=Camelina sativa TaxID=90675 RepID=A0ABM0TKH4_CAMSA|nr:PREDICTED: MATH domain and coiled-coil domain-containing protein At3g58210-like [Camelina sativa]
MGTLVDNKFTWVIPNFSSLQSKAVYSDQFVMGGCTWHLLVHPEGFNKSCHLSLFLEVADNKSLPPGWRIRARYLLSVVNQHSEKSSKRNEASKWFDQKIPGWGLSEMLPLPNLHAKDGGFLVNDELNIVAEVDVLEVIGILDVSLEFKESTQLLKKVKVDYDSLKSNDLLLNETPPVSELMDINGFQLLPSQVDFVKRIFEKHPDIAKEFRPKNPHLRKACMTFLLSLIETLCQPPQRLSNEDLVEADNALTYVKVSGFKVDWLEKKLKDVKEKKVEEQNGEIRIQELEGDLKEFKQKCLDIEALLEKEKAKVMAARVSLTLDDVI